MLGRKHLLQLNSSSVQQVWHLPRNAAVQQLLYECWSQGARVKRHPATPRIVLCAVVVQEATSQCIQQQQAQCVKAGDADQLQGAAWGCLAAEGAQLEGNLCVLWWLGVQHSQRVAEQYLNSQPHYILLTVHSTTYKKGATRHKRSLQ